MKFSRILVLLCIVLASISLPASADGSAWARETESYPGTLNITVYRSPSCNCCGGWMTHLNKHGFQVTDIKTSDLEAIKQKYHLPSELASCHTALIDGYVIEGHVPADDIKRFLKQKPNLAGLSVPQMPVGTPGMETEETKEPFEVLSFAKNGAYAVFAKYHSY